MRTTGSRASIGANAATGRSRSTGLCGHVPRGLATALIEMLAEAGLDRGIHTFSAAYLAQNRPVAALLVRAGGRQLIRQGIAEAVVALDRERVTGALRGLDSTEHPEPGG